MQRFRRRDFLKRGAATAVGASLGMTHISPLVQNPRASASFGPNDKIVLGFIGVGRMGQGNLKIFMKHPDVEVAALCDVYSPNLEGALKITEGRAKTFQDFRGL